jgi:hypothetical protein
MREVFKPEAGNGEIAPSLKTENSEHDQVDAKGLQEHYTHEESTSKEQVGSKGRCLMPPFKRPRGLGSARSGRWAPLSVL